MTIKEALKAINATIALAFADEAPPADKGSETAGKLSDGTVVEFTKLEAGGDFMIMDADGKPQPAAPGNYELEDGTLISVKEAGKIDVVTASGEAPPVEAAAATPADVAAMKAEFVSQIAEQKKLIDAQAAALEKLTTQFSEFKKQSGSLFTDVSVALDSLASQEAGVPAGKAKQTVFGRAPEEKQSSMDKAAAGFKKFNEMLEAQKAEKKK